MARRISSNPWFGVSIRIHKDEEGRFSVEIPEYQWKNSGWADAYFRTPRLAFQAGLDEVRERAGFVNADLAEDLEDWRKNLALREEKAAKHEAALQCWRTRVSEAKAKLAELEEQATLSPSMPDLNVADGDPSELPDDEEFCVRMLDRHFAEPFSAGTVSFRLAKDFDGDGDRDHVVLVYGTRQKDIVKEG